MDGEAQARARQDAYQAVWQPVYTPRPVRVRLPWWRRIWPWLYWYF